MKDISKLWEEKNSIEPMKNSKNKNELETFGITKNTEIELKKNVCEDIGKKKTEWKRNCPKCGTERYYTTISKYNRDIKRNSICKKCYIKIFILKSHLRKNNGPYVKNCLKCGRIQEYSSLIYLNEALRKKTFCGSCIAKARTFSKKTRKRLSKSGKNKVFSENHRLNLSKSQLGIKSCHYGKKLSEEHKRKIRSSLLKRLKKLGIGTKVDEGSREWFKKYNKENNTNYRPRRFLDVGYDADGYDEKLHSWIEYDSLYHRYTSQQKEDLIRQNNIIEYYKSIGRPLNKFLRFIVWTGELKTII
jgi:hypothetical protein